MGVRTGSTPRDDVLQGELDDAIFAASFGKLVRNEGPLIYRDPDQFFRNTNPTTALTKLCKAVPCSFRAGESRRRSDPPPAGPKRPSQIRRPCVTPV